MKLTVTYLVNDTVVDTVYEGEYICFQEKPSGTLHIRIKADGIVVRDVVIRRYELFELVRTS